MPPLPEIDEILSQDAWIRRLARQLVRDPNQADDLAQDAWVAALERPSTALSVRPWLAGVLRNLTRSTGRGAGRREQHERAAARPEALPSTAELVEEVTLRREVADRLLELEEPYRSTLYLRFFRDQSLAQIAKQMNVPVSTAHARLQRGLEKMRTSLDRVHGGDRSAWALALAPLAKSPAGLAATALGGVMTTGVKIAVSVVAVGGAIGLWVQNGADEVRPEAVAAAPIEPSEAAPSPEAPSAPRAETPDEREVLDAAPAAPVVTAAPTPGATLTVHGRVIDTSQRPLAAVDVRFLDDSGDALASARTDPGGGFSVERPSPESDGWSSYDPLQRKVAGGSFVIDDARFATLAVGVDAEDRLVIVAEPRADFAGTVVDEHAAPVAGAAVAVRVRPQLHRELGFSQLFSHDLAWLKVETDEQGEFQIQNACGGDRVFLDVGKAGFDSVELELGGGSQLDMLVVLERVSDVVDVTGVVLDADGAPLPGARVSMGHTIERTDGDGEFTVHWSRAEARDAAYHVQRDDGVWVRQEIPLHIAAVKPGHLPVRLELEDVDLTDPLVLRMGPAPLSITGRVVDEQGQPLTGIGVWARDLTRFGNIVNRANGAMSRYETTVEEQLRDGGAARGAVSGEDGVFAMTGLLEREYDLQVFDTATGQLGAGWKVAAGTDDLVLVLARDSTLARVAGRVVSAGGAPIPDVAISVHRSSEVRSGGRSANPPDEFLVELKTDDEGRFEFPRLATEGTSLLLFGERIFFTSVALADFDDLTDVEIVEPLLCELQVALAVEPAGQTRVQVLDAGGEPLLIVESFGVFVAEAKDAKVREGRTAVLRVPETAATLVLLEGEEEVTRRPLRVDPLERTLIEL
jgi:RNA polymerase sigma-70 factor (ECF subfamily)